MRRISSAAVRIFRPETARRKRGGFSLTELVISIALLTLVTLGALGFMEFGMRLYVKGLSVTLAEYNARRAMELIARELQAASGPPVFLNEAGEDMANADGGGLGVRYNRWSDEDYNERDSAALIVVNGNELRFYRSGFLDDRLNGEFRTISRNIVAPTAVAGEEAENLPFHFTSYPATDPRAASRLVDVNLRVLVRDYSTYLAGRQETLDEQNPNTFQQLRTMIGYRFNDRSFTVDEEDEGG